jgi:HSP20 family protein
VPRKSLPARQSAIALLHGEVNQLLERLALLDRSERLPAGEWNPDVDVYESHGQLEVVVEVPGLAADALSVVCRERELVIRGERRAPRGSAGIGFLCLERPHGRFERCIPLEGAVDLRKARAVLRRGLLTISLPRLSERRGRETVIPIEREHEE